MRTLIRPLPSSALPLLVPGSLTVTTGVAALDSLFGFGRALTAHPHYDAKTDRTVAWAWAQNPVKSSLEITVVEWGGAREGHAEVQRSRWSIGGCSVAPHDFAVTDNYYVFLLNKFALDLPPYVLGLKGPAECLLTTGEGTAVHLSPRPGGRAAGREPVTIP